MNKTDSIIDKNKKLYFAIKRVFDIFSSIFGCIFFLLLTGIVKTLYVFSGDKAPIIYFQIRVGKDGKPFKLFKFRSMVPNADAVLSEILQQESYRKQWENSQKIANDPRVTKIGKVLRRFSLDEVPQFINIIKGDMSLVGPRPLLVGELTDHGGSPLYNTVKPGLTGWWACNGRSRISYRERLELEYYYVNHCSLYLDIICIIKTIFVVLKRDGAE